MSENDQAKSPPNSNQRAIELGVSANLMSLDEGLYCIYHAPNQVPADEFGLPGLRISLPPFKQTSDITIETFSDDGWLGAEKSAALVRIAGGAGLLLVTVYQNPANGHPAPKLQFVRLNDAPHSLPVSNTHANIVAPKVAVAEALGARKQSEAQVADDDTAIKVMGHVQRMGDVAVKLGDWVGIPDSKTWIEGFSLVINDYIKPDDIEYQAVLGKGWKTPWFKGNQFCGSRGASLPLCGLSVKLTGDAAKYYRVEVSATFIDGTKIGPISDDTALCTEDMSPLEAFSFNLIALDGKQPKKKTEDEKNEDLSVNKLSRVQVASSKARTNVKLKNTTVAKAAAAKMSAARKGTSKK